MHSQHYPQPRKRARHATLERRDEPAVYAFMWRCWSPNILRYCYISRSVSPPIPFDLFLFLLTPHRPHPFFPRRGMLYASPSMCTGNNPDTEQPTSAYGKWNMFLKFGFFKVPIWLYFEQSLGDFWAWGRGINS